MKILLIEDDAPCAELLMLRLAQLGCTVVFAENAEEAFELAIAERPDLVLTDLRLEGDHLAGVRFIQKLKSDPRTARTPVVAHSVYMVDAGDLPELEPLLDGVLPKPFSFAQLKALIHAHADLRPAC